MKSFTIIEAFSHSECIYSQVLCLKKAGHHVHFIGNTNLKDRIESFGFDSCLFLETKEFKKMKTAFKIRQAIIRQKSECVVFNTAQGNFVRQLCLLPFPKKIEFVGLMHNVKKLHSGFSQKIISRRVKKYFVLNDYIKESQQPLLPQLQLQSFYPIYFPHFNEVNIEKGTDEVWITIPGAVESARKDYSGLLELIQKTNAIPANIRFIFLGRCKDIPGHGLEVKEWVLQNKMEDKIKLFTFFISDDLFHTYIMMSDFIMPSLHPQQGNYNDFLNNKISGSFNLAFAYHKPLLCYEDFKDYSDFKENSVFYNYSTFSDILSQISERTLPLPESMYSAEKWNLNYQQARYLQFCKG